MREKMTKMLKEKFSFQTLSRAFVGIFLDSKNHNCQVINPGKNYLISAYFKRNPNKIEQNLVDRLQLKFVLI